MDARAALRRLRAEWLDRSGASARDRRALDGRAAAVLMYHRVLPAERARALAVEPGMFVTPDTFERHLDWLLADFVVLPLREVVDALVAGRNLPRHAVAITFDDGWQDNYDHAFEPLRLRGLPATIFLVTERVGTHGAFWPDEVCRRVQATPFEERGELAALLGVRVRGAEPTDFVAALKPLGEAERGARLEALRARTPATGDGERELLDWSAIERMAGSGIEFESHGASHAILTGLPDEAVLGELTRAREALRARGLGRAGLLAYPSGAVDERVRRLAGEVGYRAAVTTQRGVARPAHDRLLLPRIGLHEDVSGSRAEFHRLVPGRA